jgi:transcriptional regulator with XRE-family HTH domain
MIKLKQIRERKLITQKELADNTKLTIATISMIENNVVKPRFSTIKKLARALNVGVEELTND